MYEELLQRPEFSNSIPLTFHQFVALAESIANPVSEAIHTKTSWASKIGHQQNHLVDKNICSKFIKLFQEIQSATVTELNDDLNFHPGSITSLPLSTSSSTSSSALVTGLRQSSGDDNSDIPLDLTTKKIERVDLQTL